MRTDAIRQRGEREKDKEETNNIYERLKITSIGKVH